jgi:hypothetical protein
MPSAPSDKHLAHFGTVGTGPYDLAPQLMPVETPDMEQAAEPRGVARKLLRRVSAEGAGERQAIDWYRMK